jgi:hypothetical protein
MLFDIRHSGGILVASWAEAHMKSAIRTIAVLLALCFASGCLTRQVARDGINFRQALLDIYTDQVMDNLIRASQNRPFVQLAYRNLIVTDAQTCKASASNEADPSSNKSVAKATSALLTSMHAFTDRILFGGSLQRDRTMQFLSDPVTGQKDVYEYYLAFANDPALFCSSQGEPKCAVHIKKKCDGKWYWVPQEASGVFLQLALKTTFMRGPQTPPPIYWDTTIGAVISKGQHQSANSDKSVVQYDYEITFLNPVPNDGGDGFRLIADLDGCREIAINLFHFGPASPATQFTNVLKAQYDAKLPDLTNHHAKVLAPNLPNPGPESPDLARLNVALANYRQVVRENIGNQH